MRKSYILYEFWKNKEYMYDIFVTWIAKLNFLEVVSKTVRAGM